MRVQLATTLLSAALLASACTTTATSPEPGPTVTVTATETVTEAPTDVATPEPVVDGCGTLANGEELAFVFVTSPTVGAQVQPGFTFTGCANTFEAAFQWRLLDASGNVLADGFGTATCGTGCVGDFQVSVPYTVSQVTLGSLEVFDTSAEDGSIEHMNAIPVMLNP